MMRGLSAFHLVALLLATFVVASNAADETSVRINIPDSAGTTSRFESAVLFKSNDGWTDEFRSKLAPMIMEEVTSSKESNFGRLNFSGRNARFENDRPTVYFKQQRVTLHGTNYNQAVFIWFYAGTKTKNSRELLVPQGVRITLDDTGFPVIWEVLAGDAGQIYVSNSLAAAAKRQFGEPLRGRGSALERSLSEAKKISVTRVISDGPMTMGPVVYIKSAGKEVSTILCRCMVPEVKNLVDTRTYDLITLDEKAEAAIAKILSRSKVPLAFTLKPESAPNRLERGLRLPNSLR